MNSEPRAAFADSLRGFALIGICVVNLPFIGAAFDFTRLPDNTADLTALMIVAALFEGKFFILFSLLFGFGFARQLTKIRSGETTTASYARRLSGLALFGAAHATLLFTGDILLTYAILGGALWLLRDASDKTLLRIAVASLLLAALCFALLGVSIAFAANAGLYDADQAIAAYRGGFTDALAFRLANLPSDFIFIALFNWPLAFGAFCVGLVAGRRGLLDDPARLMAHLRPHLPRLSAGAIIGNGLYAASFFGDGALALIGFTCLAFGAPSLSALYVYGLAKLWRTARGEEFLTRLGAGGRMSLTNYLGQSLIANVIFMGWGFSLFDTLSPMALLLLALLIAGALLFASQLWLSFFRMGPDEWLLRSWTALQWQRLSRERSSVAKALVK